MNYTSPFTLEIPESGAEWSAEIQTRPQQGRRGPAPFRRPPGRPAQLPFQPSARRPVSPARRPFQPARPPFRASGRPFQPARPPFRASGRPFQPARPPFPPRRPFPPFQGSRPGHFPPRPPWKYPRPWPIPYPVFPTPIVMNSSRIPRSWNRFYRWACLGRRCAFTRAGQRIRTLGAKHAQPAYRLQLAIGRRDEPGDAPGFEGFPDQPRPARRWSCGP